MQVATLIGYSWSMSSLPAGNQAVPEADGHNLTYDADQPGLYRVRVRGLLPAGWSKWFYDLELESSTDADGRAVTSLTGRLPDQSALHGLLERIRDTGLQLLSVDLIEDEPPDEADTVRAGELKTDGELRPPE